MDARLEEKIAALPTLPGVYLMRDREGEVIYVGKAVNLRSRVRSYFNAGTSDSRAFVGLLEHLLGDLETVVVSNEKEALLLENELIKKHRPRFNVQLRDDKNFICLRLDTSHPYPRLEVVRRFKKDGARYFGPYASASSIRETLRIINRYFQLRTCSDHVLENRRRPCLLHQIGRCPAPCVYELSAEEYGKGVADTILFLEGRTSALVDSVRDRMKTAAAEQRFEDAARVRDQLFAIERSLERQKIATTEPIDQDVFGLHREADRILFYALYVRQGRLSGGQAFAFTGQEFPEAELLESFVNLYYANENFIPKEVLLPLEPEGMAALAELLSERKGEKVRVLVPRRGEKLSLVEMSAANAKTAFQEQRRSREEVVSILERLQQKLQLRRLPRRIECFDISHFQGSGIVASLVTAEDGEADRSGYRRFRIKTLEGQDDFASMREVVARRVRRGLEDKDLPDLFVIDGGKGQLASAHMVLRDHGIDSVDVVSLAKSRDLEVPDRDQAPARSPERVFLVGRKDPVVLPPNSPELFVLTRLRDEAHRFAITFQQKVLRRRNLRSALDDVPGIGPSRKRALLRHFGSLKRISEASIEELCEVERLGPAVAERLHSALHARAAEAAGGEDEVREASLEDASSGEGGSPQASR